MKDWRSTSWCDSNGQNEITLPEVLDILKEEPVRQIPLSELDHIRDLSLYQYKVLEADLSYPIIIIEKDGHYTHILDGHHRRQKALLAKKTHISAKILRICCLPVQFDWLTS